MPDPRPVLELKNVSKRFPTHHAVKEILLEFSGETRSLIASVCRLQISGARGIVPHFQPQCIAGVVRLHTSPLN